MICLAIAIGVLGIAAMRRAQRGFHGGYSYSWYGPFDHGWHVHPFLCGPRNARVRAMLHALFARIDASPAQERAIINEVEKLQDRVRGAKSTAYEGRGDLAAALRGQALDDAALGAVLGRVDAATSEARSAVVEALHGVHGILDARQRAQISDLLDRGAGWRGFGPYR